MRRQLEIRHQLTGHTYIIYTPAYDKNIGGICALHYLSDCLRRYGATNVYLTTYDINVHWHAESVFDQYKNFIKNNATSFLFQLFLYLRKFVVLKTFKRKLDRKILRLLPKLIWNYFDKENTVVIYPEIIKQNPLNAKHVVRWVLNDVNAELRFSQSDHIFKYQDFYEIASAFSSKGRLTVIDLDKHLKIYKNNNTSDRKGGAYLIKKGWMKRRDQHPPDYPCIDKLFMRMSDEERASYFNQIEVFISYDHMTFICEQAALCGCLVIIIPDDDGPYSRRGLIEKNRIYGVAYGIEDIKWANDTRHQLRPHLESLNDQQLDTVRIFKEYCEREIFK